MTGRPTQGLKPPSSALTFVDNSGTRGTKCPFWQVSLPDLLRNMHSSPDGLSALEAAARLRVYGPNMLERSQHAPLLRKFISRLRNPLMAVLLFAASISALTGDVVSFSMIVTMVLLGVALDTMQEYRAERAADRLRASVSMREHTLRDEQECSIPAEDLVPGDVVLLAAGDLVPADCYVLQARDLFVNEALLTGESFPVEKHASEAGVRGHTPGDASNAVFMGTSVLSGSARVLVCATGRDTQLGGISRSLRQSPPPAALQRGTYEFGMLIVRVTVMLTLAVLLINVALHRPLLESFLFALALAVGLTPELLPMVVSVTLARGALRMSREHVIVKRLAAIHDLGSMDVLCTDKTGTLTEAHIRLVRQLSLDGADSPRVLELAWLNSHFESGLRSPLDTAILEHGSATPGDDWSKLDEVPFDFERRRVSVLLQRDGRRLLVVKGAPEDVLRLSSRYEAGDPRRPAPLDEAALKRALMQFERLGEEGYRVLGIASREVADGCEHVAVNDERELVFAGFAAFLDPPKQGAREALQALRDGGIAVKIVSGDNERVTQHLCRELGLPESRVLGGEELRALSDEALTVRASETTLFCRVTPAQKHRIIMALKQRGHVVGFLGDGINDAPSLHCADVGISVDSAVDVAKDAADIILLRQDLLVLARGVREGRRTFGNIMKYVMMGTSSNFGNMFSMAGATLLLPFLPMRPVQVLLNNLLYDLSEVPIPMDEVDEESLVAPQHWDMHFVRNFMLVLGPVSSLFDFLTFAVLLYVFDASASLFQSGWFVESLASQVLVIFVIRTRRNPLRSRPSRILALVSLSVVALAFVLPATQLGHWFGLVPLPWRLNVVILGMAAAYLLLVELVKRWFFRCVPPVGARAAAIARPTLPFLAR